MTRRSPEHVVSHPLAGDVLEVREVHTDEVTGERFEHDTMLRIVAVHEDRVWLKEYGKGHVLLTIVKFRDRCNSAIRRMLIRGADHDAPF